MKARRRLLAVLFVAVATATCVPVLTLAGFAGLLRRYGLLKTTLSAGAITAGTALACLSIPLPSILLWLDTRLFALVSFVASVVCLVLCTLPGVLGRTTTVFVGLVGVSIANI